MQTNELGHYPLSVLGQLDANVRQTSVCRAERQAEEAYRTSN